MPKTYKRGASIDAQFVDVKVSSLRLELLIRVMDRITWAPSETVVCSPGSSRNMLRLVKRYHRVSSILTTAASEPATAKLASSPYASTLGVRLLLDELILEETKPEITTTDPVQLDEQLGTKAKVSNRFARKPMPTQQTLLGTEPRRRAR